MDFEFPVVTTLLLLLVVLEPSGTYKDLLETFRPKAGNPAELNDFLAAVLEHRDDFDFVRQQVKRYNQKAKKDIAAYLVDEDFSNDAHSSEQQSNIFKRHISKHEHRNKRKHHHKKRKNRYKRTLLEDSDDFSLEIPSENGVLQVPGEKYAKQKKEALVDEDFVAGLHHATKNRKLHHQVLRGDNNNDLGENLLYLDSEPGLKRPHKRRYEWIPQRPDIFYPQFASGGDGGGSEDGGEIITQDSPGGDFQANNRRVQYSNPKMSYQRILPGTGPRSQHFDYADYHELMKSKNPSDNVEFEQAQSFEIAPNSQGEYEDYDMAKNNPRGNSLISVDAGISDRMPFEGQAVMMNRPQPPQPQFIPKVHPEVSMLENSPVSATFPTPWSSSSASSSSSSTTSTTSPIFIGKPLSFVGVDGKTVTPFGDGFIEISKTRRDVAEDDDDLGDSDKETREIADQLDEMIKNTKSNQDFEDSEEVVKKRDDESAEEDSESESEEVVKTRRDSSKQEKTREEEKVDRKIPVEVFLERRDVATNDDHNLKIPIQGLDNNFQENSQQQKSGGLTKNSLHPLRMRESDFDDVVEPENSESSGYQSRKLKSVELPEESSGYQSFKLRTLSFVDDAMLESFDKSPDTEEEVEVERPKRGFLEVIQMDNEDDYAADNAFKKELLVNNTDVNNDTRLRHDDDDSSTSSENCSDGIDPSLLSNYHDKNAEIQKQDVVTMTNLIENPKEFNGGDFGGFKSDNNNSSLVGKVEKKRAKNLEDNIKHQRKLKKKCGSKRNRKKSVSQKKKKAKKLIRKVRDIGALNLNEPSMENSDKNAENSEDSSRENTGEDSGGLRMEKRSRIPYQDESSDDEDVASKIALNKDKIMNFEASQSTRNADFAPDLYSSRIQRKAIINHFHGGVLNRPKIGDFGRPHGMDSKAHNLFKKEDFFVENLEATSMAAIMDSFSLAGFSLGPITISPVLESGSKKPDSEATTFPIFDNEIRKTAYALSTSNPALSAEDKEEEAYDKIVDVMDMENEKIAQLVSGKHAAHIVEKVWEQLKQRPNLKSKFMSGLSRKHDNFDANIDFNVLRENNTNDILEARMTMRQLAEVVNRIVNNQIRRKLCQKLPDELKEYLHNTLNDKSLMLENRNKFEPNKHQGNFLFSYQEDEDKPPFDAAKLQDTLTRLEGLLLSYQSLDRDCKSKAEPVRDYIEKHVKMLHKISGCPSGMCAGSTARASKRHAPRAPLKSKSRDDVPESPMMVQEQLESVGLGSRSREFLPNFDLNKLIESNLKKLDKREVQIRHQQDYKSDKYKRLQLAVEKIRQKRENEKRIAQVFGGGSSSGLKTKRQTSRSNFEAVDFEEPLVYSL